MIMIIIMIIIIIMIMIMFKINDHDVHILFFNIIRIAFSYKLKYI